MVSYQNKEQYVDDKKKFIRQIVKRWLEENGDDVKVVFIDDDPGILAFLRSEFSGPNFQIIEVDADGNPYGL
jgi:hypothetical protein